MRGRIDIFVYPLVSFSAGAAQGGWDEIAKGEESLGRFYFLFSPLFYYLFYFI